MASTIGAARYPVKKRARHEEAMRLQKATRLALYAVTDLARQPTERLSTTRIAAQYGVSTHHLAKVLQALARAGVIRPVRGAGGGYVLAANARRTSLLDIVTLFEDPFGPAQEDEEPGQVGANGVVGALDAVLEEIDDLARATLGSITIETLIRSIERRA
jgi:Rrf2 family protein